MIQIYGSPLSQPTRAVLWTCTLLKIKPQFMRVDATKGDHQTKDFLKMNPNAKFPVLKEDDFVLWESHAIMRYLVNKYGDNSDLNLYPSDLQRRALTDAWLDWKHTNLRVGAAGIVRRRVMSKIMKDISKHSMKYDLNEIPEEREARILVDSLRVLEEQLTISAYITGNVPTIADIALLTEIEQLAMLPQNESPAFGRDLDSKYKSISSWQAKMRSLPGFDESHAELSKACSGIDKMRAKSKI